MLIHDCVVSNVKIRPSILILFQLLLTNDRNSYFAAKDRTLEVTASISDASQLIQPVQEWDFTIFVVLCEAIGRAGDHILGVLFLKYLFDAIERGDPYTHILAAVAVVGGYSILFELFNKWRLEVYTPRTNLKLHEGMQGELYRHARALDLPAPRQPAPR